jgi:hypothetical protein
MQRHAFCRLQMKRLLGIVITTLWKRRRGGCDGFATSQANQMAAQQRAIRPPPASAACGGATPLVYTLVRTPLLTVYPTCHTCWCLQAPHQAGRSRSTPAAAASGCSALPGSPRCAAAAEVLLSAKEAADLEQLLGHTAAWPGGGGHHATQQQTQNSAAAAALQVWLRAGSVKQKLCQHTHTHIERETQQTTFLRPAAHNLRFVCLFCSWQLRQDISLRLLCLCALHILKPP